VSGFVFWDTPPEVLAKAAPLYADLAALRMQRALMMVARKYQPDQPRMPAGNPEGGQWTDAGGGLVDVAANDRGEGHVAAGEQISGKLKPGEMHVTLPDGKLVPNPYSKTGYLIAPEADLSPVAEAGRQAGAVYQQMLTSTDTDIQQAALPQFMSSIGAAVGQAGAFDYQRNGNRLTGLTQLPEFRDVSNFNVGLYMQQTEQFSEKETLSLAGTFARYFSSNYMSDQPYGLDPRTASFIRTGYRIGASGLFGRPTK
jgi:hypothetical protein